MLPRQSQAEHLHSFAFPSSPPSLSHCSLRKPKDAKAGAASALKSVGKGFLAGAVSLVAAPLIGAKEGEKNDVGIL